MNNDGYKLDKITVDYKIGLIDLATANNLAAPIIDKINRQRIKKYGGNCTLLDAKRILVK